jgi:hypothetical protein
MTILHLLIRIAIVAGKLPVVRLMLYICFGALSKTCEALFIGFLPMDPYTRAVFVALHFLALAAFCIDVINFLCESLFGISLYRHRDQSEGKPIGDERRSILDQVDLRQVLSKAKALRRSRRQRSTDNE